MAKKWTPPAGDLSVDTKQWTPPAGDKPVDNDTVANDQLKKKNQSLADQDSSSGSVDGTFLPANDPFLNPLAPKTDPIYTAKGLADQQAQQPANTNGFMPVQTVKPAKSAVQQMQVDNTESDPTYIAQKQADDAQARTTQDYEALHPGHWMNALPELTHALTKTVTQLAAPVADFIHDGISVDPTLGIKPINQKVKVYNANGTYVDDRSELTDYGKEVQKGNADKLGNFILTLNAYNDETDKADQENALPHNFLGNTASGFIHMAPDIATAALFPEGEAVEGIESGNALGSLKNAVSAPFTKLLAIKGAAAGYTDAEKGGDNALLGAATGMISGTVDGVIMHGLGDIAGNFVSKPVYKTLTDAGLVSAGKYTQAGVDAFADAVTFGAYPIAQNLVQGKPVNWDDVENGIGTGLGFGLLKARGTFAEHGDINQKAAEIIQDKRALAVVNFMNASPDAIKEAWAVPSNSADLNAQAVDYAHQVTNEPDLDKKKQLAAASSTYTKISDIKTTVEAILSDRDGFIDNVQKSQLPDETKETLISKINAIDNELHPDEIAKRHVAETKIELGRQVEHYDGQVNAINDKIANTIDPTEKQQHYVDLNEAIGNRVKVQNDLFKLSYHDQQVQDNYTRPIAEIPKAAAEQPKIEPVTINNDYLKDAQIVGYDPEKGVEVRMKDGTVETLNDDERKALDIGDGQIAEFLKGKNSWSIPEQDKGLDNEDKTLLPPKEPEPANNEFEQKLQDATDPKQVAAMYDKHLSDLKNSLDMDGAIADYNGRMSRADFVRYGDKSNITNSIARSYFEGKNLDQKYIPLDIQAQEVNDRYFDGHEVVGPEEFVDFAVRHPGGHDTYFTPAGNEQLEKINKRYKELTGKNLNKRSARKYAEEYHVSKRAAEEAVKNLDDNQNKTRVERNVSELLHNEGLSGEINTAYLKEEFESYLADHTNEWNIFHPVYDGNLPEQEEIDNFNKILDEINEQRGQTGSAADRLPDQIKGIEPTGAQEEGSAAAEPGGYDTSTTEPERVRTEYNARISDLDDEIERAHRELATAQQNINANNDIFTSNGVDDGKKSDGLFKEPANVSQANVDRILKPITDKISRLKSDRAGLLDEQEKAIAQAQRQTSLAPSLAKGQEVGEEQYTDIRDILAQQGLPNTPENIAKISNEKVWYHGSGKDLSKERVDSAGFTKPDSLLGLGFYMTDDPSIAKKYSELNRNKKGGIVNEFKVNLDKVLDAEAPIDPKVEQLYKDNFNSLFENKSDTEAFFDDIKKSKPNASMLDYHRAIANLIADDGYATNDVHEHFQDLEIGLKDDLGYDAINHIGGVVTKGKNHNVMILLDPAGEYSTSKSVIKESGIYDPERSSLPSEQAKLGTAGTSKLNPEETAFVKEAMHSVFPHIQTRYYDTVGEFNQALAKTSLKDTISRGATVHAFVDSQRVIHFNPAELTKETPIHEQGHILTSWARVYAPDLYKEMLRAGSEMTRVHEMLRANGYRLDGAALHEEAFVTALGRDGAKKLKELIKSDTQRPLLRQLITDAWTKFERWITEKTGYSLSRGKSIKDMNFGEFTDLINEKYLLSGTKIADLSSEELARRGRDISTRAHLTGEKPEREDGESLREYAQRVADWRDKKIDVNEELPPVEKSGSTANTKTFDGEWQLPAETTPEKIQRKGQDYMNRAKKVQDAIKEAGGTIDKDSDFYNHQRRTVGITEHELDKVNEDLFKSKDKNNPALFEKMKTEGIDEKDLGLYLYAKHAEERNNANGDARQAEYDKEHNRLDKRLIAAKEKDSKRDITYYTNRLKDLEDNKAKKYPLMPDGGSGMKNQEAKDIISKYEADGTAPKLDELAKEFYDKVTRKQIRNDLESGRISQEDYDYLNDKYKNYVPLHVEEKEMGKGGGSSSKLVKVANAFKKAKGAEDQTFNQRINPAKYGVVQLEKSLVEGEKNKTLNTLRNLVENNPNPEVWEVIRPRYKPVYNADGTVDKMDEITDNKIKRESMYGFDQGRPFYIHIKDDILRRAMLKEWKMTGSIATVFNAISSVTSLFRNTATIYNPAFWAKNIIKDNFSAVYNLNAQGIDGLATKFEKNIPSSFKGVYEYEKGIRDTPEAKIFERYLESGARISYSRFELDTDKLAKMGDYFDGLHENKYNPVVMVKKLGDYMGHVSEVLELTTRVAAFSAAVESGIPDHEAAIISKESTIDFAQKGEWSSVMNSLYLFSNAGVQGTTTFFKNFAKNPKAAGKVIGGMVAIGIMAAAYNHKTNGDANNDPASGDNDWKDYFRISDYEKQGNLILRNPLSGGFIKIPTGHELGVYGYLGDKLYNVAIGKANASSAAIDVAKYGFQAYTPFQGSTLGQAITPNIAKPVIQLEENQNSFGTPIYNQADRNSNTPQSQLHFSNTNPIYINMADQMHKWTGGTGAENGIIEIPPEAIKFAFETVTGGAGKTAEQSVDLLANSIMLKPTEVRNIPILYSFYTTGNHQNYKAGISAILQDSRKNDISDIDRTKFYQDAMKAALKHEITDNKYESMVIQFQKNQERIKLARRYPDATGDEIREMMK